jgi:hypothetical protein
MLATGLGFTVFYPISMGSGRDGWVWEGLERSMPFEHMLYAMYITLGLFLIWGARDPMRFESLINYTIVANFLHACVMFYDGLRLGYEHEHLHATGDVVATFLSALVLLIFHPRLWTWRAERRQATSPDTGHGRATA